MNEHGVFKPKQRRLIQLLHDMRDIAEHLRDSSVATLLQEQEERVARYSFKVLVMGEFDTGKSTLINALLGAKVLPAWHSETTAIPCEIKYTDEPPYAKLYSSDKPSRRMQPGELEKELVVPEGAQNPYRRAEIFWPLDLCRDGVEIVDSPGLNASTHRDDILVEYLEEADAIIFFTRESGALGLNQMSFLQRYVFTLGHAEDIFCVINWMTSDQDDKERVVSSVRKRLASISETGLPPAIDRLFVLNALQALKSRLPAGDVQAFETSGVPEFEKALQQFLIRDRGRAKLQPPARVLLNSGPKLRHEIEIQRRMYAQKLTTLIDRYEAEKPNFQALEKVRAAIIGKLDSQIGAIVSFSGDEAQRVLYELAAQFPDWAAASDPSIGLTTKTSDEQRQEFAREVANFVDEHCWAAELDWESNTYRPALAKRLLQLGEDIKADVEGFVSQMREVRSTIVGPGAPEIDIETAVSRVLTDTHGIQLKAELVPTNIDVPPVKSSVMARLVKYSYLPLAAVHPIGAIIAAPFTHGVGWIMDAFRSSQATERTKRKLGDGLREGFENSIPGRVREFMSQLTPGLHELYDYLDTRMAAEIRTVNDQVEAVIFDMRAGKDETSQRLAALDRSANEIDRTLEACGALLHEIEHMAN